MYNTESTYPDPDIRLPAFTVATALTWLGHENCSCPMQVDERANVWLVKLRSDGRPRGIRALLDVEFVDPPWSRSEGDGIVAEINVCTSRDRIQVELRDDAERVTIPAVRPWLGTIPRHR